MMLCREQDEKLRKKIYITVKIKITNV